MYGKNKELPTPLTPEQDLEDLDTAVEGGDANETPFNVFIGHNLGHRVFVMSVPFRKFHEISDVANDREAGPVAQRPLDMNHAKKLAVYMLKGLVSAAMLKRNAQGKDIPKEFDEMLHLLGRQPYFSMQPIVCNIRSVEPGGAGIRGLRLETVHGETACFKVFLAEKHTLWVVDGQHRRKGADLVMAFLNVVRTSGKFPGKAPVLVPKKGEEVSEGEMLVWNEAYDAARSYATLTIEVHLGLDVPSERQLFHDLNNLGKSVQRSLALQFDTSNPITGYIKSDLVANMGLQVADKDVKNWSDDEGALVLKDIVAINAIAFLNKGNVSGATPAVIEPRQKDITELWVNIMEIPHFGDNKAKEKTVSAQPVVLKALAKLTFDFLFSNRRPDDGEKIFKKLISQLLNVDFSHDNPMWRYYEFSNDERDANGLSGLTSYLPEDDPEVNRDIGAHQGGFMRFGAKHNDIFPLIGDMIRWKLGLPNRHVNPAEEG